MNKYWYSAYRRHLTTRGIHDISHGVTSPGVRILIDEGVIKNTKSPWKRYLLELNEYSLTLSPVRSKFNREADYSIRVEDTDQVGRHPLPLLMQEETQRRKKRKNLSLTLINLSQFLVLTCIITSPEISH